MKPCHAAKTRFVPRKEGEENLRGRCEDEEGLLSVETWCKSTVRGFRRGVGRDREAG